MTHSDKLHINLFEKCMKCTQRQYSGNHFRIECKHVAGGVNESKHSYIDYNHIIVDNSQDKDDDNKVDLIKILNNKKVNII